MKNIILILFFVLLSEISMAHEEEFPCYPGLDCKYTKKSDNRGYFSKNPQLEFLPNGKLRLINNFSYTEPSGKKWIAHKGLILSGKVFPKTLMSMLGFSSPFSGKFINASIIYEAAYIDKKKSWKEASKAYYFALRDSGVSSTTAKLMYATIYNFHPKWNIK